MQKKSILREQKGIKRGVREATEDRIFEGIIVVLLAILSIMVIYPLYFVVIASFSEAKMVIAGKVWWRPVHLTLENYEACFHNDDLMIGYRNSLAMLALGTTINLILTTLCAYPLSRKDLWGRKFLMLYTLFPMFFSGGMIPTYLLVGKTLKLANTWWAVLLVGGIATYNMIIMRTFFGNSIPFELQEAAEIDGCNPFMTLVRIILPLSLPVMCVIGLYYGVSIWNSYFQSLIYLTDSDKWPLQLFLRQILLVNNISAVDGGGATEEQQLRAIRAETIKYSVVILSSVPMLIIYPFVQRHFVKGVMIGSVKG